MTGDTCAGVGTPARNVTRAWVGSRLPVVGECQACGKQVEITREWTTKRHAVRVVPACDCPVSGFGYRHHRHPCPRAGENESVVAPEQT